MLHTGKSVVEFSAQGATHSRVKLVNPETGVGMAVIEFENAEPVIELDDIIEMESPIRHYLVKSNCIKTAAGLIAMVHATPTNYP